MKNLYLYGCILLLSFSVFSQEIQEESFVVNIEVPVRVFSGDSFVQDLSIDDFEVLEDGIPQKIEAVYLINKRNVERSEEKRRFVPETRRNFYLFFEITDYDPRIRQAIEYFIQNVLIPSDNLVIVTPMKTYRMKSKTFEIMPKEKVVKQLVEIIRKDAMVGSSEYKTIIDEIASVASSLSAALDPATRGESEVTSVDDVGNETTRGMSMEEQIDMYSTLLSKLDSIGRVDQKKLMAFADYLKDSVGQKYVFMFYQREFIPQIETRILDQTMSALNDRPDIVQKLTEVMNLYRREVSFNVEAVQQAYADSSIAIHFLFLTTPPQKKYGVQFEEHSEDIFSAFSQMSNATGGFTDSSMNADFLMREAVEASENYYLLYYSPTEYRSDGKFRKIEVRVKRSGHQVSHRAGYFAN
jgi:VWFA-related protein